MVQCVHDLHVGGNGRQSIGAMSRGIFMARTSAVSGCYQSVLRTKLFLRVISTLAAYDCQQTDPPASTRLTASTCICVIG